MITRNIRSVYYTTWNSNEISFKIILNEFMKYVGFTTLYKSYTKLYIHLLEFGARFDF